MRTISVVMGTCNDAETLPETLDSVLAQDFPDFEFIVVNDGSTERGVREILENYVQKDERIKTIHKQNEGLTRALIDGCARAQGDYIARIDAGDVMLPGRLTAQANVLNQHPDCAFVACWTEFCGPLWERMWLTKGAPQADSPVSLLPSEPDQGLLGDIPHHGSVMIRRSDYERAGGYRPEFYFGQDWDLWYRLAERGHYQVVPRLLYRARYFPSSISMTSKRFQDEIAQCSRGAFLARRLGSDEREWLARAQACRPEHFRGGQVQAKAHHEPGFYFVGEALRRRGDARARKYLAQAMRESPASPRAYIRWLQTWLPKRESQACSDG